VHGVDACLMLMPLTREKAWLCVFRHTSHHITSV
jgi:hypothetical protein